MNCYQLRESDAIDRRHPVDHFEPIEDERTKFADAQCRLVVWLMTSATPASMGARVMVLATALNLTVGTVTEADIARACGITRSAVSLISIELEDQFGIKSYNLRPEGNRTQCSKAQTSIRK